MKLIKHLKTETDFKRTFFISGEKNQDAKVIFRNGQLEEVVYHISRSIYTYQDWQFLGSIADFLTEKKESEALLWSQFCCLPSIVNAEDGHGISEAK